MTKITIEADELKRLKLTLAIARRAKVWGVSDFALEDVVARAMQSAQIDSSGQLTYFNADVFLSGIAVDESTQHLVDKGHKPKAKTHNPAYGDLSEAQFNALLPEERLRRINAVTFADKKLKRAG
jgi:hypothetical protein